MIEWECEFCEKTFTQKSSLLLHQRSAKKCLKLRGIVPETFTCQWCSKSFTQKGMCNKHELKCSKNGDIPQEEFLAEINALKKKLQEKEAELEKEREEKEEIIEDKYNLQRIVNKCADHGQSVQNIVINNFHTNPNIDDLRLDQDPQDLLKMLEHRTDFFPIVEKMIKKCIFRSDHDERCLFITDASRHNVLYREDDKWKLDIKFQEGLKKICAHAYKEIEPLLIQLRQNVEENDPDESEILQMNQKLFELGCGIRNPDSRSLRRLKKGLTSLFFEESKRLEI